VLQSLRVIDFRCFRALALELGAPRIYLTGENAQGKTSLLEAIAVAARLGSPRASRQRHIVREGADGCGVALQTDSGLYKAVYQDRKFGLSLDGAPIKKRDYLAHSPRIVWMENRDLDLVRGSGERRRRYLDAIGSQLSPHYAQSLRDYTKALRSRNALLKEQRSHERSFAAFTDLLITHGQTLVDYRQRIITDLLPHIALSHHTISADAEQFSIAYQPSAEALSMGVPASLHADRALRQTTVGPHRDDFSVLVDQRPAADFASEGQQRTLALALRLGQGYLLQSHPGAEVLYLIDDVFGELDARRRLALLQAFPSDAQAIFTTTQLNWGEVTGRVHELKGYELSKAGEAERGL